VPTSADALVSHAAWAGEARFPFALASDSGLAVAERYGSRAPDGRRLSASGARRRHGAGGPTCAAAHSMVRRSA
jgi:peroxiredoxin